MALLQSSSDVFMIRDLTLALCVSGKLGSGERVNIDCYDKKPETSEKASVPSNFTDGSLH